MFDTFTLALVQQTLALMQHTCCLFGIDAAYLAFCSMRTAAEWTATAAEPTHLQVHSRTRQPCISNLPRVDYYFTRSWELPSCTVTAWKLPLHSTTGILAPMSVFFFRLPCLSDHWQPRACCCQLPGAALADVTATTAAAPPPPLLLLAASAVPSSMLLLLLLLSAPALAL
jgi:hypothetical protein